MHFYQKALLVAGLTAAIIAAGIAYERIYLSPQVERMQRQSEAAVSATETLPPECLQELTTVESPASALNSSSVGDPQNAATSESSTGIAGDTPPAGNDARHVATLIQVVDSSLAANPSVRSAEKVRSAGWVAPAANSGASQRLPPRSPTAAKPSKGPGEPGEMPKPVDVLDLMRRLRADDGQQRAEARRELLRRGFSEVDLELARQLFSPDTEARKQLAREVPRLSSVDAARWLMWLALDPQPEVRLAALSTLATTGDPALLTRVEALARKDRDQQIQALANRIAKQRDLADSRGTP